MFSTDYTSRKKLKKKNNSKKRKKVENKQIDTTHLQANPRLHFLRH